MELDGVVVRIKDPDLPGFVAAAADFALRRETVLCQECRKRADIIDLQAKVLIAEMRYFAGIRLLRQIVRIIEELQELQ